MVPYLVKDLGIALKEAQNMGVSLPGTALAKSFYDAMIAQGESGMCTQGVITVIEKLNNTHIK